MLNAGVRAAARGSGNSNSGERNLLAGNEIIGTTVRHLGFTKQTHKTRGTYKTCE